APASATIAPGATSTVTVTPKAIPTTASLASDAFADTVTITSDVAGDAPHVVALHQSATGAVLAFSPGSIHFGAVPVGTTTSGGFQIVNSGNAAASVSLASSNGAFVVPAGATSIGASASASLSASFAPGQSTATQTSNVTMSVSPSTALCAPLPSPLALDGAGSKGVVKLSTAALDFKNVSCGTAGAAQQVVVTNSGNQDFTITGASLGLGA